MSKYNSRDISEIGDFVKFGDTFTKVRYDDERHRCVWKRTSKCGNISYEVWIGRRHRNPDGSIVYSQPRDEDFGMYGFTVMNNKYTRKFLDFLMISDDLSPEARRRFKENLKII